MKVLYINTVTTGTNGITNAIFSLIDEIKRRTNDIQIGFVSINPIDDNHLAMLNENQINWFVINRSRPIRYYYQLKKIIKKNGYDIVHAHGNSHTLAIEMMAAKRGKCKMSIAHGQNSFSTHPIIHKILTPFFVRYTDYGLACSKVAGDFLFGPKIQYEVIRNGITTNLFLHNIEKRNAVRTKLGFDNNDFVLGNVSRISEEKNPLFLVDVMQKLKEISGNFKLIFIGDGPQKAAVKDKIESLHLNEQIIITGFAPSIDYLDAIDLFVMPSFFEGLPISLIEAQANGLKCLCSENITKEASINNMIKYLPINGEDSIGLWVNSIEEFSIKNNNRQNNDMSKSEFDIKNEVSRILEIYFRE